MSNDKRVYRLLKSKKISVGKAEDGTFLCSIPHEVYGLDFEQKRGKERLYVITNKNLKEELDEE